MNIDNNDDMIDSRDLVERMEELQEEIQDAKDLGEAEPDDVLALLGDLEAFAKKFEDYAPDFHYGETAIRDSYFQEYAQQLAEDCGMVEASCKWPNHCIDWERAAHELQQDYSAIDFDGVTYWVR